MEDNEFIYDIDEAVIIVWKCIPEYLRIRFDFEAIYDILCIEQDYLDLIGVNKKEDEELPIYDYPAEIDWEGMKLYIIGNALKQDIFLTHGELRDILDAELKYYEINRTPGDMGEYLNWYLPDNLSFFFHYLF